MRETQERERGDPDPGSELGHGEQEAEREEDVFPRELFWQSRCGEIIAGQQTS